MAGNLENSSERHDSRWRIAIWGTAAAIMLLPAVAMQFTDEVDWSLGDFVVFGAMLIAACGTYESASRLRRNSVYRAAVGVALATAFLLTWMNLAVGIMGSEETPANLMFGGVLIVGIIGAMIARLQANGMSNAMVATAIAQVSVAAISLIAGLGNTFIFTIFFVALWLTSAWLFRKAAVAGNPRIFVEDGNI